MLNKDRDRYYIVYPSWAKFSYTWDRLPTILSNPVSSGHLDAGADHERFGFAVEGPRIEFLTGSAGGGVIIVHAPLQGSKRWLGLLVLASEAIIATPGPMLRVADKFGAFYLEPQEFADFGLGPPMKPERYVPAMSMEHVDYDTMFWLVDVRTKADLSALAAVPDYGRSLGLQLTAITSPPETIAHDTASWFVDRHYMQRWYSVIGGRSTAEFQFAAMMYVALQLRKEIGSPLRAMHLISRIDGMPRSRYRWSRR